MTEHADQPGLRMRLAHEARKIAAQHEILDGLERDTLRALESADAAVMRDVLDDFASALDGHFTLEEDVHFPALHGLDESCTAELDALVRDHRVIRGGIAQVVTGAGRPVAARDPLVAAFREVMTTLRDHEKREEALFARVVR